MSSEASATVVLVHAAWADASSWNKIIPALLREGMQVAAVQIPLTSLSDDVRVVQRVLKKISGPVVLAGHSYGGAVITGAAAGNPNVKALVYVAAFAPDANEPLAAAGQKFAAPPLNAALVPDSGGFLYVDRAKFRANFCQDLPASQARVMAATQKPLHNSAFGAMVPEAAWKTIPSWYIVSSNDRAINPDLERFYAKRAGAKTTEIASSHVAFLSHPKEVVKVIENAAK